MSLSNSSVFKDLDSICRRLLFRTSKYEDPILRISVRDLARLCKLLNQKYQQYLTATALEHEGRSSLKHCPGRAKTRNSAQDLVLDLEELSQECRSEMAHVMSLLDSIAILDQGSYSHMNGNRAPVADQFRTGSLQEETSFMKTKMARVGELTESLFLPNMISDAKEQLMKLRKVRTAQDHEVEDAYQRFRDSYHDSMNNMEKIVKICNAHHDRIYVHTFTEAEKVPYEADLDIPQAEGSFGIVYKAVNTTNNTVFAVKMFKKVYSSKQRSMILKELGLLDRCNHPNLLTLMDAYQVHDDPHTFYLVTQPWAPYTLEMFIHETDNQRRKSCPWFASSSIMKGTKILMVLKGLADGLDYLHEHSIKHKDIKPDNILLYDDSTRGIRPIIADFGESKVFRQGGTTNYSKSTYHYLAPEQVNHTDSSLKADVWQMGCCFAFLLVILSEGSRGSWELWGSFNNDDPNCSCRISTESEEFMETLRRLCWKSAYSQEHVLWIVTGMLELLPTARMDIRAVREELSQLT
ncbi:putative serine threonine-protein kinase chk2 protein [Botrytis fragariae]|uniref:Autophagy-related protein 1 n=1 Tax=Botrytis fragariae TaxID=1964551 RepID=A0A8H6AJT0_9HELO|nr:putative serine threonine-protein kinase chk2 protein [Botrytis fragariae]KAF5868585.1 putative serine threonine-protein kinase chk2 protein [Botrytis fragariae]